MNIEQVKLAYSNLQLQILRESKELENANDDLNIEKKVSNALSLLLSQFDKIPLEDDEIKIAFSQNVIQELERITCKKYKRKARRNRMMILQYVERIEVHEADQSRLQLQTAELLGALDAQELNKEKALESLPLYEEKEKLDSKLSSLKQSISLLHEDLRSLQFRREVQAKEKIDIEYELQRIRNENESLEGGDSQIEELVREADKVNRRLAEKYNRIINVFEDEVRNVIRVGKRKKQENEALIKDLERIASEIRVEQIFLAKKLASSPLPLKTLNFI